MSRNSATAPAIKARLFVETVLTEKQELTLEAGQAHYLRGVLRLTAGQSIGLFNGRDGEWRAEIVTLARSAVRVILRERRRAQEPSPDIWLCFAPLKKTAIDSVAAKATELGTSRLRPVLTAFTAVSRVNTGRLRANAVEAAEQCERLDVPRVDEPEALEALLDAWPIERPLLVCAEAGQAVPIAQAAAGLGTTPFGLLIGPEGGFSPTELDRLAGLAFVQPVGLGPRILRADTAAVAALAICLGMSGNLAARPPDEAAFYSRHERNER